MSHIQLAHFSTFDVITTFYVVLSLYGSVRVIEAVEEGRATLWPTVWAGAAAGWAVASKFSALPILAALFIARRLYPLHYRRTAMLLALAAGMIPALFMQIACMYDPSHILLLHVLPGLSMALVAAALAAWWPLPR